MKILTKSTEKIIEASQKTSKLTELFFKYKIPSIIDAALKPQIKKALSDIMGIESQSIVSDIQNLIYSSGKGHFSIKIGKETTVHFKYSTPWVSVEDDLRNEGYDALYNILKQDPCLVSKIIENAEGIAVSLVNEINKHKSIIDIQKTDFNGNVSRMNILSKVAATGVFENEEVFLIKQAQQTIQIANKMVEEIKKNEFP